MRVRARGPLFLSRSGGSVSGLWGKGEPFFQEHGLLVGSVVSYQGRLVDALGQSAEEGRDKRRNAWGSGKGAEIPGYPNGATRPE